ncbi:hypothetical protein [Shewanella sedimentimangrovi]|uniref:Uncharacterized protein n=1 Tax=Shewanella sedimentimangrovi TaxID=2814293 RepID=A0ABX7QZY9_9GAMM|nr:hypothetical protein [Shewanella sedimentimangrovi]QSX37112.1 hypothetical protein JYB85_17975 [Shewanella sedimentimangrovi]
MKFLFTLVLMLACAATATFAADDTKPRLVMKAEKAHEQQLVTEAEQLQKAKAAAAATEAREQKLLEQQQHGDWEDSQRQKAVQQFSERELREQKYLKQARDAAKQERKIAEQEPEKLLQERQKPKP